MIEITNLTLSKVKLHEIFNILNQEELKIEGLYSIKKISDI